MYWIEISWYIRWNFRLSVIPIQIDIFIPYLGYLAIIIRDISILCIYHWHIFILGLLIHSVYLVLEFSYLRLLCNNLTFCSILTSRCVLVLSFDLLNLWLCCCNACIQKVLLFVYIRLILFWISNLLLIRSDVRLTGLNFWIQIHNLILVWLIVFFELSYSFVFKLFLIRFLQLVI